MFGTGWAWQYTPYTLMLLAAGSIMAAISSYSWRNRDVTGATSFAVLIGATALWAVTYGLQLAGANEATTAFWADFNHIGVAVVPVAWFIFALQFTSRDHWLNQKTVGALSVVPVLYLIFVVTNQYHYLVREPIDLQPVEGGALLVSQHDFGVVFWLHAVYGYLLMLGGVLLLAHLLLWSPTVYRRQVALLIFGALLAAGTNAVFHAGLTPAPAYLDLTPFSFAVAGVIFFVAIYQYQLFDLNPIARPLVVDRLQEGVIVLDPDGRVLDLNDTAVRLLGLDSEQAIGRKLKPCLPEESQFVNPRKFETIRESAPTWEGTSEKKTAARTGANKTVSHQTKKRDHSSKGKTAVAAGIPPLSSTEEDGEFPVESELIIESSGHSTHLQFTSSPVRDVGGTTLGYSVVVRDVTETRNLQQEIEATLVELRQSNEELDSFAGIISHDLREPLRTTERYLSLFEQELDRSLDDEQAELLAVAQENAERAQQMIDDLLAYSRIDSEATTLEQIDCNQLVSDVLTGLQFEIDDRDATVEVGNLPTVEGVDHLLRRLLQNLLTNSLAYAGDDPPEITITGNQAAHKATITVSDKGVGIEPENIEYVFDLFNRAGRSKGDGGTGMGLAICQKIVAVHDGTIDIDSTPGEGTTITISLPTASKRKPTAESREQSQL